MRTCVHRNFFIILPLVAFALVICAPLFAQEGWQVEIRLTENDDISFPSPNNGHYIAVDLDGRVHVVWADERDRNFEIYHKYRSGGTWSEDERLTTNAELSKRPVLTVDSLGRLHLVWNDSREGNKEIYHRIWTGSWSAETRVTSSDGDSYASSIAADGFNIHLVYHEEIDGYLQIIYNNRNALMWAEPEQISFVQSGMSMVPTIAVGPDGAVHVAWWDTREDSTGSAAGKICYRKKIVSWSNEEIISGPLADAMRPNIAIDDSGNVHVAWIDKRESAEQIYYRRLTDEGWGPEIRLTTGNYTHYHPSLVCSEGKVHLIFWSNYPSLTNSGIFYMMSYGNGWTGALRMSGNLSEATLCSLASEPDGTLHAAWKDSRDGNDEIYYNTFLPTGTGIGEEDDPPEEDMELSGLSLTTWPNPFRNTTIIRFSIPASCEAELKIYDVTGACIKHLFRNRLDRGHHPFAWDGRDDRGTAVAPGMYFARARAGKIHICSKIMILK